MALNWKQILQPTGQQTDVDTMWATFENAVTAAQEKCIPNRMVHKGNKKWAVPLAGDLVAKVKKKHRLWTRYMETDQVEKLRSYKQMRNKVRNITRRARRQTEISIANDIKTQPKRFWNYVNSKSKVHSKIPDLEEVNGERVMQATTDKEKAEMLSKFFSRVLIADEDDNYEPLRQTCSHYP